MDTKNVLALPLNLPTASQKRRFNTRHHSLFNSKIKRKYVISFLTLLLLLGGYIFWRFILYNPIVMSKMSFSMSEPAVAKIKGVKPDEMQATVKNAVGEQPTFQIIKKVEADETIVRIQPPVSFKPGKHTLQITIDGVTYMQDFTWGVLAVNTNKSIYAPEEKATIAMAVLDETGMMVCDAEVRLQIRNPNNEIRNLGTFDKSIRVNKECDVKNYTTKPDYESEYITGGVGKYEMTLKAKTTKGEYTITDSFEVREGVPFSVERDTATRLYPIHKYPVKLRITANEDFTGQIVEKAPDSFEIAQLKDTEGYSNIRFGLGQNSGENYRYQEIIWNVTIKKGETKVIGYQYDPPDKSPDFFLLGPLQFYSNPVISNSEATKQSSFFSEVRSWQLANDAVSTAVEQQVNIMNQIYSTTSQTASPTDNSLGLITFDDTKYNNETVYVEADLNRTYTTGARNHFAGQYKNVVCLTATDCKMSYYVSGETALYFKDCDDASCTSGSITLLDGYTGCVLAGCSSTADTGWSYHSLACSTTNDCKISYFDSTNGDLRFADCDTSSCSSGTSTLLDGRSGCVLTGCLNSTQSVGTYSSISCPATDDCKISYYDATNGDLRFTDCAVAVCSSGTSTLLDGRAGCVLTGCSTTADIGTDTSIACPTATDCKISYHTWTSFDLRFADCATATCSSGTATLLDGNTGCVLTGCNTAVDIGMNTSIACPATDDCKISYTTYGGAFFNQVLYFADCATATCSSGTVTFLDGDTGCVLTGCIVSAGGVSGNTSIACPSATDCKVGYDLSGTVNFADCATATCSSGTTSVLDGGSAFPGKSTGDDSDIFCLSASDCKISYRNVSDGALYFKDCDDATCTVGTISLLDGSTSCVLTNCLTGSSVGTQSSIFCPSTDDCKISYYDSTNGDLRFADCATATCTSGTSILLDGNSGCVLSGCLNTTQNMGMYSSIFCPSTDDCKISYYDSTNGDLRFADCATATCTSGTSTLLDGRAGCVLTGCLNSTQVVGQYTSISCPSATDCKISFYDNTNRDLLFADCDNATCSAGTSTLLDGRTGCVLTGCLNSTQQIGSYTSIACPATDDCKISYYDSTNGDLRFADCSTSTCSSGNSLLLDGNAVCVLSGCATTAARGMYTSIACPATDDCKISYYDVSSNDLFFADCSTATCSSGSVTLLDGNTGCVLTNCLNGTETVGLDTGIACPATDDCKITYLDDTSDDLRFADCATVTCSSGTANIADNGEETVTVELYDSAGGRVTDGIVQIQPSQLDTSVYRIRQPLNLTLSNGTNYTARVRTSSQYASGAIYAVRLVIPQAAGGGITATETQVEIGNYDTTTSATYEPIDNQKIYYYDAHRFGGTVTKYFEASLRRTFAGTTAYAALFSDASCNNMVPGSEVTVSSTSFGLVRSNALVLSDNTEYVVCIKTLGGTTNIANAKIIINQSSPGTLDNIEVVHDYINTSKTNADTAYTSQNYFNQLTKANFAGDAVRYYYEATMKASGGSTGYTQLYNSTDSSVVTDSELSTTESSYTRVRSSDLASNLTTAKTYDTQIKNSATDTTDVASSRLIIQIGNGLSALPPSKIVFTNQQRSFPYTSCSPAFTMELQDDSGQASNPISSTVVRVTSDSIGETIYSDNTCSTTVSNGDFTFTTAQNSKTFYIRDTVQASATLSATRQSGDTLATGTQSYNSTESPSNNVRGGVNFRGGVNLR